MEKKIILTGGGSAGHVTPNLALLPQLLAEGIEVHYIGTADGIERTILSERKDVTYHIISSGKLRRYFSWKNFTDPFRVMRGLFQARRVMREVKPAAVFSKGGFVSVPVVIAAHGKHIHVSATENIYQLYRLVHLHITTHMNKHAIAHKQCIQRHGGIAGGGHCVIVPFQDSRTVLLGL